MFDVDIHLSVKPPKEFETVIYVPIILGCLILDYSTLIISDKPNRIDVEIRNLGLHSVIQYYQQCLMVVEKFCNIHLKFLVSWFD